MDWDDILEGAEWFHCTGITPALGKNFVDICEEAYIKAKQKEIKISYDLNNEVSFGEKKRQL